ncbi:MAG: Ada metal-binding domain-containing protein [Planctomycetota bacterium]|jgi:endonuclease YncB( thermonuclease family)
MEREDMFRKITILVILCVLAATCSAAEKAGIGLKTAGPKTYGGAVVSKVLGVGEGFSFRCNVDSWPAVIGENITVRIGSIAPPLIAATETRPNKFFELQAIKFLKKKFAKAHSVRLENIKRGRIFSIVADVIVDSNSIADLMIAEGLARRYVGAEEMYISPTQQPGAGYNQDISVDRDKGRKGRPTSPDETGYVASKNSKIFHRTGCRYTKTVSASNLVRFDSTDKAQKTGRRPCKTCNP